MTLSVVNMHGGFEESILKPAFTFNVKQNYYLKRLCLRQLRWTGQLENKIDTWARHGDNQCDGNRIREKRIRKKLESLVMEIISHYSSLDFTTLSYFTLTVKVFP